MRAVGHRAWPTPPFLRRSAACSKEWMRPDIFLRNKVGSKWERPLLFAKHQDLGVSIGNQEYAVT